jgi:hypothetical protein
MNGSAGFARAAPLSTLRRGARGGPSAVPHVRGGLVGGPSAAPHAQKASVIGRSRMATIACSSLAPTAPSTTR